MIRGERYVPDRLSVGQAAADSGRFESSSSLSISR